MLQSDWLRYSLSIHQYYRYRVVASSATKLSFAQKEQKTTLSTVYTKTLHFPRLCSEVFPRHLRRYSSHTQPSTALSAQKQDRFGVSTMHRAVSTMHSFGTVQFWYRVDLVPCTQFWYHAVVAVTRSSYVLVLSR